MIISHIQFSLTPSPKHYMRGTPTNTYIRREVMHESYNIKFSLDDFTSFIVGMSSVILAPWKSGCLVVWDATCPDTFAPSYRAHATQEPGKVAEAAEDRKCEKYMGLPPGHFFSPVAIETLGAIVPKVAGPT